MSEVTGWNIRTLIHALGDEVIEVRGNSGIVFGEITTDSRRITKDCVFIAIKGERFDGHDFVVQAAQAGAGVVIVERWQDTGCTQVLVRDTLEAYGRLAAVWRAQFAIPLICVVGSNGKTTTTQMIASILRTACGKEAIVATRGNFNNHIGVPQMLLELNAGTKAAVIEAGMNHPGEMARLVSWIRPTVVVITNAQREHQEFLDGVEASARENGLAIVALSAKGTAVLPAKDKCLPLWCDLVRARGCRLLTYARGEAGTEADESTAIEADITVSSSGTAGDEAIVIERRGLALDEAPQTAEGGEGAGDSARMTSVLKLAGRHALHDAAAAAAASLAIGVRPEAVARGLADFKPVAGRGVHYLLRNGAILIDDAYNANPDSMRAAIDVLADMPGPRVLVVGDMAETGSHAEDYHAEIGEYAKKRGIDRLLAAGEYMRFAVEAFGIGARHFETIEELTHAAQVAAQTPGTLLVKASNAAGLSRVVDAVKTAMSAKLA